MTVSNTKNSVSYQGTGSQKRFDFSFLTPKGTAVVTLVETLASGGYKTTTLAASHYVVTGEGSASGGYVTLNTAPTAKQRVTIRRELPLTQGTDLVTGAGFYPESVEDMVDESRMIDQQLAEGLARAVKAPEGVNVDPLDYYNAMMDSVTASASSALAASAAESSAHASKIAAANSATAAAKSESNAASSATKAATSESNAANSATSANVAKIEWKGSWSAATSYAERQAVYYQGSSWIAKAANKNVIPGDNASWGPLAMGGDGVAVATTTTSGIARQATMAEAVAGTINGAVFITPTTANLSRYIGGVNTLDNTTPSGARLYILGAATNLTLAADIEVGKKFTIFWGPGGGFSITPPPTVSLIIRGGAYGSSAAGAPFVFDVAGSAEVQRVSSVGFHIDFKPDVNAAITARLASNTAMLEKKAKDVAVTPYGLTVMQIINGDAAFSDLNSAKAFGAYIVVPSALNNPFASAGYLHVNFGSGTSVYMTQQFNSTSGRLAIRGSSDGGATWGAWAEMAANAPGQIGYFAQSTPPSGWIKANGAAISRTNYAALFAAIGVTYGAGNGSTTFNAPDLRGEFPRGWDDGRGIDAGRVLGSAQGDAIRNITGRTSGTWVNTGQQGALSRVAGASSPDGNANYGYDIVFDASLVVPTAAENRPRNVALLACIKY